MFDLYNVNIKNVLYANFGITFFYYLFIIHVLYYYNRRRNFKEEEIFALKIVKRENL